jgi:hypothetical protein
MDCADLYHNGTSKNKVTLTGKAPVEYNVRGFPTMPETPEGLAAAAQQIQNAASKQIDLCYVDGTTHTEDCGATGPVTMVYANDLPDYPFFCNRMTWTTREGTVDSAFKVG